jgi:hypothetical protein
MDILEKEISELKEEIDGYKTDLKGATGEDRNLLLKTIITRNETLNKLLDEKKALQTAGAIPYHLAFNIQFSFSFPFSCVLLIVSNHDGAGW